MVYMLKIVAIMMFFFGKFVDLIQKSVIFLFVASNRIFTGDEFFVPISVFLVIFFH